mmetsp:Transcript_58954/g.126714  ORF Transcript_58954/g.126714 Transcript_58954/m.126714 type:complete len:275 (+) Transcript_58954:142-966(+)
MEIGRNVMQELFLARRLQELRVPKEVLEQAIVHLQRVRAQRRRFSRLARRLARRQHIDARARLGQEGCRQAGGGERRGVQRHSHHLIVVQGRGEGRIVDDDLVELAPATVLWCQASLCGEEAITARLIHDDIALAVVASVEAANGARLCVADCRVRLERLEEGLARPTAFCGLAAALLPRHLRGPLLAAAAVEQRMGGPGLLLVLLHPLPDLAWRDDENKLVLALRQLNTIHQHLCDLLPRDRISEVQGRGALLVAVSEKLVDIDAVGEKLPLA